MAANSFIKTSGNASAATSGNTRSTAITIPADIASGVFFLDCTTVASASADTLNVYLQHSVDGSTWDDFVSFSQVIGDVSTASAKVLAFWNPTGAAPETEMKTATTQTLAAGAVVQNPVGQQVAANWVTVGTGSFTFSVSYNLFRANGR